MISEVTLMRLNRYFVADHRARAKTLLIVSAAAILAFLMGTTSGAHEKTSLAVAFVVALLSFGIRLRLYVSLYDLPARVGSAPGEDGALADFFYGRRTALARLSALAVGLVVLEFVPSKSAASVLNSRIRDLMRERRRAEAAELAERAIRAGIPLDIDVLPVTGVSVESPDDIQRFFLEPHRIGEQLTVSIGGTRDITIRLPVVGIPLGHPGYLILGTLSDPGVSLVGLGPGRSTFFVEGTATAFISLHPKVEADTLFCALNIHNRAEGIVPEVFLAVSETSRRTVVYDVRISYMTQELANVEWISVVFDHCRILVDGERLSLERVVFQDCQFEFCGRLPEFVSETIQEANGRPVSLRYPGDD